MWVNQLNLARRESGEWHLELVDGDGYADGASLAVDGLGRAHIAYRDYYNAKLKYAQKEGASWTLLEFTDCQYTGMNASLALSPQGLPWIAHSSSQSYSLLFSEQDEEGGWFHEVVDAAAKSRAEKSLAVTPGRQPFVVYCDGNLPGLKYAVRQGGGEWTVSVLVTHGGRYCSLAMDSEGDPHVCYQMEGYPNSELWYVVWE